MKKTKETNPEILFAKGMIRLAAKETEFFYEHYKDAAHELEYWRIKLAQATAKATDGQSSVLFDGLDTNVLLERSQSNGE